MIDKIEKFLRLFPTITKEESDYIADVLNWDDETKLAFGIAKRLFEEDDYDKDNENTKLRARRKL